MSTATQAITFAEFETLPDAPGKRELLNGEVIELPPATFSHMDIVGRFFSFLISLPTKSRVMAETGYRIGGGWLQPDVSVTWPDQQIDNDYLVGSPMVAIEIASPSNTAPQFDEKIVAYFEGGAAEVWIVYPKTHSMMVHVRDMSAKRYTDEYDCQLLGASIPLREILRPDNRVAKS